MIWKVPILSDFVTDARTEKCSSTFEDLQLSLCIKFWFVLFDLLVVFCNSMCFSVVTYFSVRYCIISVF